MREKKHNFFLFGKLLKLNGIKNVCLTECNLFRGEGGCPIIMGAPIGKTHLLLPLPYVFVYQNMYVYSHNIHIKLAKN